MTGRAGRYLALTVPGRRSTRARSKIGSSVMPWLCAHQAGQCPPAQQQLFGRRDGEVLADLAPGHRPVEVPAAAGLDDPHRGRADLLRQLDGEAADRLDGRVAVLVAVDLDRQVGQPGDLIGPAALGGVAAHRVDQEVVIDASAGRRDVVGQPVRVIPDDPIPPG